MAFPIRTCAICSEEFELKPDKPGFANRCPECSAPEADQDTSDKKMSAFEGSAEADAARRAAIRELLYSRK